MKKILNFIILGTSMFVACNNGNQTQNGQETSTMDTAISLHSEDHEQKVTKVELDNGNKWSANAETTQGINKMISILDSFPENSKPEDYVLLKDELETEFNLILQRCTMTGEAHEQLHNYLLPMREIIQNLHSDNIESSGENVKNLKLHLNEYQKYFSN